MPELVEQIGFSDALIDGGKAVLTCEF